MANDPVQGKLTTVEVSADGTAWSPICVFENAVTVDFGTQAINEESCLSQKDPIVTAGETTYAEQELSYLWTEASGLPADAIIKACAMADDLAGKTLHVKVMMNNQKTTTGTEYTFEGIVTAYKYTAVDGEVNKVYFTLKQTTLPVEKVAA